MYNFLLDIPTILFFLLLAHLAIAVTLAIYLIQSVSRHTSDRRFLLGTLLQGVGLYLTSQRGRIPNYYSVNWGNVLIFLGLALVMRTLITLEKPNKYLDIFYAIVFGLFVIVFWGTVKNLNQSVIIASAFLAFLYLSSAVLMAIYNIEKSILRYSLSLTCAVSGVLMAIRGISAFNQTNFTLLSKNGIQDATFIMVFFVVILGGTGYLLLLRERSELLLKKANHELS
ncbi:MAG: hypothetical protein CL609_23105 [Anaerolineaceae bacterium]|nr:hypothetical protein [Anaerolineaceae bacterium]